MGSRNRIPPTNSYFTEDLAEEGSADNSAMGYSEMLNTFAPARGSLSGFSGPDNLRKDPRTPPVPSSGSKRTSGYGSSKWADGNLAETGSSQYPGKGWGK